MDDVISVARAKRRQIFASRFLPEIPVYLLDFHRARGGVLTEFLLIVLQLIGLATSAALTGEYLFVPRFCRHGGGCEVVRKSSFAAILGIPTPIIGMGFFLGLIALTVTPSIRKFLLSACLAGALGGIGFLLIQAFHLGAFCPLCVVVDVSSIFLGVVALVRRDTILPVRPQKQRIGIIASGILLIIAILYTHVVMLDDGKIQFLETLPEEIQREQRPGVVTIVEFMDFHCGSCQEQHKYMSPVLDDYGERVRIVYKHMPQPPMNFGARTAVCVENEQPERIRDVVDFIFKIVPINIEESIFAAEQVGLASEKLKQCLEDEATKTRLKDDAHMAGDLGVKDLPTFWIGKEKHTGVTSSREIESSILREMHRAGTNH